MKVKDLVERLQSVDQELDVMFTDPNDHTCSIYLVWKLSEKVATKDEYPDDWNMPEGYKFILLEN